MKAVDTIESVLRQLERLYAEVYCIDADSDSSISQGLIGGLEDAIETLKETRENYAVYYEYEA